MAMVVKNNMSAVRTLNTLNKNSSALQKSLAKVSSGMKINSAQDDASGYAISERMRVQIRSLDQANQNTQNASSLMKTAEGAVSSTIEILKTLKEKAINAATDTNTDQDRATIQKELNQFIDQIDDNALTTFNGKYLVDGSKSQSGVAVATAMTNMSLGLYEVDGTTELTGDTSFTKLTNRNGDSLEISSADYVTASFVKNGRTYTTKYRVGKLAGNDASGGVNGSDTTSLNDLLARLNAEYGKQNAALSANGMAAANGAAPVSTANGAAATPSLSGITAVLNGVTITSNNTTNMPSAAATALQKAAVNQLSSYFTAAATKNSDGTYNEISTSQSDMQSSSYYTTLDSASLTGAGFQTLANQKLAMDAVFTGTNKFTSSNGTKNVQTSVNYSASAGTLAQAIADYNQAVQTYNKSLNSGGGGGGGGGGGTGAVTDSSDAFESTVTRSNVVGTSTFGDKVYTGNEETGLTITAANVGITGQISGLTISITDSEGNVKKSANASLDAFSTTIYAKNKSDANELTFQVGAKANQAITVGLDDMRSEALGLKGSDGSKVSVATQDKANAAVAVFDNAIQKALDQQATIGAIESRLEYTSNNLTTSSENVQAAESTIRDADMAKEMTEYTKNNVLLQAAQSMLAQANQNSSSVLSLLQ